jgi:hypothetical protein
MRTANKTAATGSASNGATKSTGSLDQEALIQAITERVMAALAGK